MRPNEQTSRLEKAQSMLEFAVSAIVILMLLVAVIDFGRAFFTYIALRDAAQEGAMYGSICPADLTGITTRAKQTSTQPVDLEADASVVVECFYSMGGGAYQACSGGLAGSLQPGRDFIKIQVKYTNFQITTPLLGNILGGQSITLRADAIDTILRAVNPKRTPCP